MVTAARRYQELSNSTENKVYVRMLSEQTKRKAGEKGLTERVVYKCIKNER